MSVEDATPSKMREALDEALLRGLPTISLVLAVLFVGLALLTPISDPGHVAFFAAQSSLNALLFLGLFVGLRRWTPPARLAHPLAFLIVTVLLLGSFTEFVAQPIPLETVGFMLVAIGAGIFFTSTAWFIGAMIAVVLTWAAAVSLAAPSPLTVPLATLLAQGILLAVMAFVVRVRALRRIVALRAHELRQAGDLEWVARELATSESRFRLLAENAQDVVYRYVLSPDRRVEYISPSATVLTGYSPDEFYENASLMLDIIHPEDRPAVERDLKKELPFPQEFRLVRKDGQVVWCEQHRRPFFSDTGKLLRIEGLARDITQRKLADSKLRKSEESHRFIADNVLDMITLHDPEGKFLYLSAAARGLLGYEPEELLGRSPYDFFHADDLPMISELHARAAAGGEDYTIALRVRRRDGSYAWAEVRGHPIRGGSGAFDQFVNTWRDITARKHLEAVLAAQRDALQKASLALKDAEALAHLGSTTWDLQTGMLEASDELKCIFGFVEPGPISSDAFMARIHEDDRAAARAMLQDVVSQGRPWSFEHRVVRPSGEVRFVHAQGRVIADADGKPVQAFGTVLDITERKVSERRLAAQHAATRVLADGHDEKGAASALLEAVASELGWAFGAVWLVHDDEAVLRCESTWPTSAGRRSAFEEASLGRSFERGEGLPGRVWSTGKPAWIRDVILDPNFPRATGAHAEGLHGAFAFPIPVGGRTVGVMEFFSTRIEEPDPELLRLMVSVGTQYGQFLERRHAEERIRKLNAQLERSVSELAQKNRDMETFSYTASHDLRAPLRAIDFLSGVLLEDEAAHLDASGQDTLKRLRSETMRMSQLVDDLLKLSRSTSGDLFIEPIDLARLARDVVGELRERDPARQVDIIIPAQLPSVGDARLIRVALENMLENAWKYTSKTTGARIEVGSLPARRGEPLTFFVRDNGAGFDMQQVGRLFQPFQRLHAKDFPGTGIGLATVHRIIHRHGGRIWAEGKVGRGATFYFTTQGNAGDHASVRQLREGVSRAP